MLPAYVYTGLLLLAFLDTDPTSEAYVGIPILGVIFMIVVIPLYMLIWFLIADRIHDFSKSRATIGEYTLSLIFANYGLLFMGCTIGINGL